MQRIPRTAFALILWHEPSHCLRRLTELCLKLQVVPYNRDHFYNIPSNVFHGRVHRLYQDVLYFRSVKLSYDTRLSLSVIPFTDIVSHNASCDSRNPLMLKSITYRYALPNFAQIGKRMWKLLVKFHIRRYVKHGFYCADLHEAHCHRIFCKWDEKFRKYTQNFIYALK
jgi:hypothetical protein